MSKILPAIVGASMIGLAGVANAAGPVTLTDTQMDSVTAGANGELEMLRQEVEVLKAYGAALPPLVSEFISTAERDLQRIAEGLTSGEEIEVINRWLQQIGTITNQLQQPASGAPTLTHPSIPSPTPAPPPPWSYQLGGQPPAR